MLNACSHSTNHKTTWTRQVFHSAACVRHMDLLNFTNNGQPPSKSIHTTCLLQPSGVHMQQSRCPMQYSVQESFHAEQLQNQQSLQHNKCRISNHQNRNGGNIRSSSPRRFALGTTFETKLGLTGIKVNQLNENPKLGLRTRLAIGPANILTIRC